MTWFDQVSILIDSIIATRLLQTFLFIMTFDCQHTKLWKIILPKLSFSSVHLCLFHLRNNIVVSTLTTKQHCNLLGLVQTSSTTFFYCHMLTMYLSKPQNHYKTVKYDNKSHVNRSYLFWNTNIIETVCYPIFLNSF